MIRFPPDRALRRLIDCAVLATALSGCGAFQRIDVSRFEEPALTTATATEALSAAARSRACFSTDSTPAVVETRTEQVQEIAPHHAPDGTLLRAATYRTVTETRIVRDRQDVIVRTLCPEDLTPQFIASLQRALFARGHYRGAITARMDADTRAAVRSFQGAEGLATTTLSLAAAKRLGLAVYSWDDAPHG